MTTPAEDHQHQSQVDAPKMIRERAGLKVEVTLGAEAGLQTKATPRKSMGKITNNIPRGSHTVETGIYSIKHTADIRVAIMTGIENSIVAEEGLDLIAETGIAHIVEIGTTLIAETDTTFVAGTETDLVAGTGTDPVIDTGTDPIAQTGANIIAGRETGITVSTEIDTAVIGTGIIAGTGTDTETTITAETGDILVGEIALLPALASLIHGQEMQVESEDVKVTLDRRKEVAGATFTSLTV